MISHSLASSAPSDLRLRDNPGLAANMTPAASPSEANVGVEDTRTRAASASLRKAAANVAQRGRASAQEAVDRAWEQTQREAADEADPAWQARRGRLGAAGLAPVGVRPAELLEPPVEQEQRCHAQTDAREMHRRHVSGLSGL